MAEQKPSFYRSVMAGIAGRIKGAVMAGLTGVVIGAAVVAALTAISAVSFPPIAGSVLLGGAATGAFCGGVMGFVMGASAGNVAGVMESRESSRASAERLSQVANVSFAQGMAIGHQAAQEQAGSHFRDRLAQERQAQLLSQKQR